MLLKKLTTILLLLSASTFALPRRQRAPKAVDKSALYAQYPQLVSNTTNACVQGMSQLLINMYTIEQYEKMISSSMHGLDDLGSEFLCESEGMVDYATYTTLQLNITHLPTALISGLCLPKACTP